MKRITIRAMKKNRALTHRDLFGIRQNNIQVVESQLATTWLILHRASYNRNCVSIVMRVTFSSN